MAQPTTHPIPIDPKYDHYDFPTVSPHPASGHPGHTTAEQDAKVSQLRMMLEQAGCTKRIDTLTMLRFLRARKFDVQLAKKMFLDCEQWRKTYAGGVDQLPQTWNYKERPEVAKYYPQYYHKTDKDGRPVYIEQLGEVDIPSLEKHTDKDRMLTNLVVEYEKVADPRLPACSRKAGALQETCCTIMDMKGLGITKAYAVWNYNYVNMAAEVSQNYYPERLGKLYVINAPWGFSTLFGLAKKLLDPVTVSKIHVLGSGYKSELLAQVPAENLPVMFGGKCKCPQGCNLSDAGPWQDPQWVKEPAWAKKDEGVIENKPSSIKGSSSQAPAGPNTGTTTSNAPAQV